MVGQREPVAGADFVDEGEGGFVAGEQEVVAVVHLQIEFTVEVGAAAAAADRSGLMHRDLAAAVGQRQSCGQTGEAGADDMDMAHQIIRNDRPGRLACPFRAREAGERDRQTCFCDQSRQRLASSRRMAGGRSSIPKAGPDPERSAGAASGVR